MNNYSVYITEDSRSFFAVKGDNVFVSGNGGQTFRKTNHDAKRIRQTLIYSHQQRITVL